MRRSVLATLAALALLAGATWPPPSQAQTPMAPPSDARRSGLDFMSPALQALQRDDSQNPGLLALQDGAALWHSPAGSAQKSCADCHGGANAAPRSMAGVATRYPAWDPGAAAAQIGRAHV